MKGISAMNTYLVTFRTDTHYADLEIEADTPEQALQQARALAASRDAYLDLDFQTYDGPGSINEIEVYGSGEAETGDVLLAWQDDDLALRNAAADLRDALEALVKRERAEAAASGFTDDEMTWLDDARLALSRAKGGVA
jgi:hypothetical protein